MRYRGGKLGSTVVKCTMGLAILTLLFLARQDGWSQTTSPSVTVTVNKSLVFRLAQRAKRVSVTQPEVADVVVLAPNQILINGKSVGTTSLVVFDDKGGVTNYDLVVTPDVAALRRQLRAIFPEEKVEVSTSGSAIVLKGEVSNEVIYDKVLGIAQTYLPPKPPSEVAPETTSQAVTVTDTNVRLPTTGTAFAGGGQLAFPEEGTLSGVNRWGDKREIAGIIDLLTIVQMRQVELSVIVAEVATSKLREIGFNFSVDARNVASDTLLGDQSGFPSTLFADGANVGATGPFEFILGAPSGIFSFDNGSTALRALYRLLQNKNLTEILAQPRLVMKSGRSGGFLAGGEFPVAVAGQEDVTIDFKPFGVRLDFVPTITWSDSIDLRVFPEVSDIDQTVAVQGIPGLRVRRSVSRVEVKEGESIILAGLLDRRILKDVTKFPILGDIPILGALFRSTRFRNQESELIFVITPRIVKSFKPGEKPELPSIEKYDDSDMRQVPLPNAPESGSSRRKPSAGGPTIP